MKDRGREVKGTTQRSSHGRDTHMHAVHTGTQTCAGTKATTSTRTRGHTHTCWGVRFCLQQETTSTCSYTRRTSRYPVARSLPGTTHARAHNVPPNIDLYQLGCKQREDEGLAQSKQGDPTRCPRTTRTDTTCVKTCGRSTLEPTPAKANRHHE